MTQLFLFLAVLFLCPVAFCQEAQNFLAKLPKRSVDLLPKSFLKPSPKKDTSFLFAHQTLKPLPVKWESTKSEEVTPYGRQAPETNTMLSPQAAEANLKVMSQNLYKPIGGPFKRRIANVVTQGVKNLGTRNSATQYYKRNTAPNSFDARAVYEYQRNHDHLGNLGRQALRSVTQAAKSEFGGRFRIKFLKFRK